MDTTITTYVVNNIAGNNTREVNSIAGNNTREVNNGVNTDVNSQESVRYPMYPI